MLEDLVVTRNIGRCFPCETTAGPESRKHHNRGRSMCKIQGQQHQCSSPRLWATSGKPEVSRKTRSFGNDALGPWGARWETSTALHPHTCLTHISAKCASNSSSQSNQRPTREWLLSSTFPPAWWWRNGWAEIPGRWVSVAWRRPASSCDIGAVTTGQTGLGNSPALLLWRTKLQLTSSSLGTVACQTYISKRRTRTGRPGQTLRRLHNRPWHRRQCSAATQRKFFFF